jgi:hypothetical protein
MRRLWPPLLVLLACGSSTAARPEPETPPKAAEPPTDPTADCAAIDEIFTTFKYPASETPGEAELVRYYGNVTKAFRELRLTTPELQKIAKDVADLFGALGGRADMIAKAYVGFDAAMSARNRRLNDLFETMKAVWNLREFCESAECKRLFEIEKAHHAIVRLPTDDVNAFRSAVRAFRADVTAVPAVDSSVGFARKNLDNALGLFEEATLKLLEAQAALDDASRAKESKLLRGRILGYCPQLGEKR